MPLWGTARAGANPISGLNFVDLRPGDHEKLLDGTETIATGSRSIAFARGNASGSTFTVTGCPNNSVIDIQASSTKTDDAGTLAAMDASFQSVSLSGGGGTITGNGFYTDVGFSSFYRVIVTTFGAGDVPVVTVKR